MARQIKLGNQRQRVHISSEIHDAVDRALREGEPELVRLIETELDQFYREVYAAWPVNERWDRRPERSRDAIFTDLYYSKRAGEIRGVLYGDLQKAPHIYQIRSLKVPGKGMHAWTEIVRKPGNKLRKKVREEIRSILVRAFGGK